MSDPWWRGERWQKILAAGAEALTQLLDMGKIPVAVIEGKSFDRVIIPRDYYNDPRIFRSSNGECAYLDNKFWLDEEPINDLHYYILYVPKDADPRIANVERKPLPSWLSNGCQT